MYYPNANQPLQGRAPLAGSANLLQYVLPSQANFVYHLERQLPQHCVLLQHRLLEVSPQEPYLAVAPSRNQQSSHLLTRWFRPPEWRSKGPKVRDETRILHLLPGNVPSLRGRLHSLFANTGHGHQFLARRFLLPYPAMSAPIPLFTLTIELYNPCLSIRVERGIQNTMALLGFFWCNTVKWLTHAIRMSEFVTECCPHLQDRIGEAKLENATCNRWIC